MYVVCFLLLILEPDRKIEFLKKIKEKASFVIFVVVCIESCLFMGYDSTCIHVRCRKIRTLQHVLLVLVAHTLLFTGRCRGTMQRTNCFHWALQMVFVICYGCGCSCSYRQWNFVLWYITLYICQTNYASHWNQGISHREVTQSCCSYAEL